MAELTTIDVKQYDLTTFVPLPEEWMLSVGARDYDTAVEILEKNGYQVIERCLADACEIIGNNTGTYEEAIEMLTRDTDRFYPLSEYGLDTQIDIYNQWLASLEQEGETA